MEILLICIVIFRWKICHIVGISAVLYGEWWSIEGEKWTGDWIKAAVNLCWTNDRTVSDTFIWWLIYYALNFYIVCCGYFFSSSIWFFECLSNVSFITHQITVALINRDALPFVYKCLIRDLFRMRWFNLDLYKSQLEFIHATTLWPISIVFFVFVCVNHQSNTRAILLFLSVSPLFSLLLLCICANELQ